MAVTHQRPRVTGEARRAALLLALLALVGSWTGTAGAPNAAALMPSPALVAIDGGQPTRAPSSPMARFAAGVPTAAAARERVRAQQRRAGDGHRDRHAPPAIAVGSGQACAVLADGTVRCWGNNEYGQLGNGSEAGSLVPVTVLGIESAVAVAAGGVHTCALLADGAVACWGFSGAIGDGSFSSRLAPVPVDGIDDGVALAAGSSHTCVLRAGGGIACWGSNEAGQLGDGTVQQALIPTEVAGMTAATSIAAAGEHTCASRSERHGRVLGIREAADRLRVPPDVGAAGARRGHHGRGPGHGDRDLRLRPTDRRNGTLLGWQRQWPAAAMARRLTTPARSP